jgi:hypothetical protein
MGPAIVVMVYMGGLNGRIGLVWQRLLADRAHVALGFSEVFEEFHAYAVSNSLLLPPIGELVACGITGILAFLTQARPFRRKVRFVPGPFTLRARKMGITLTPVLHGHQPRPSVEEEVPSRSRAFCRVLCLPSSKKAAKLPVTMLVLQRP